MKRTTTLTFADWLAAISLIVSIIAFLFALTSCAEQPADIAPGAGLTDRAEFYLHQAAHISPWWIVALLILLIVAWISGIKATTNSEEDRRS